MENRRSFQDPPEDPKAVAEQEMEQRKIQVARLQSEMADLLGTVALNYNSS